LVCLEPTTIYNAPHICTHHTPATTLDSLDLHIEKFHLSSSLSQVESIQALVWLSYLRGDRSTVLSPVDIKEGKDQQRSKSKNKKSKT